MKKLFSILMFAPLVLRATNWTNYPAYTNPMPSDTFLLASSSSNSTTTRDTNKQLKASSLVFWLKSTNGIVTNNPTSIGLMKGNGLGGSTDAVVNVDYTSPSFVLSVTNRTALSNTLYGIFADPTRTNNFLRRQYGLAITLTNWLNTPGLAIYGGADDTTNYIDLWNISLQHIFFVTPDGQAVALGNFQAPNFYGAFNGNGAGLTNISTSGSNGGTVTSVALSIPALWGTVSSSPITSAGTITLTPTNQGILDAETNYGGRLIGLPTNNFATKTYADTSSLNATQQAYVDLKAYALTASLNSTQQAYVDLKAYANTSSLNSTSVVTTALKSYADTASASAALNATQQTYVDLKSYANTAALNATNVATTALKSYADTSSQNATSVVMSVVNTKSNAVIKATDSTVTVVTNIGVAGVTVYAISAAGSTGATLGGTNNFTGTNTVYNLRSYTNSILTTSPTTTGRFESRSTADILYLDRFDPSFVFLDNVWSISAVQFAVGRALSFTGLGSGNGAGFTNIPVAAITNMPHFYLKAGDTSVSLITNTSGNDTIVQIVSNGTNGSSGGGSGTVSNSIVLSAYYLTVAADNGGGITNSTARWETNSLNALDNTRTKIRWAIRYDTNDSSTLIRTADNQNGQGSNGVGFASLLFSYNTNSLYADAFGVGGINVNGQYDYNYGLHYWTNTGNSDYYIQASGNGWGIFCGSCGTVKEYTLTNAIHPWMPSLGTTNWYVTGGDVGAASGTVTVHTNGWTSSDPITAPGLNAMKWEVRMFAGGFSTNFDSSGLGTNKNPTCYTVGWAVCNGNNGTPPMTSSFVKGAGGSVSLGSNGGSDPYDYGAQNGSAPLDTQVTVETDSTITQVYNSPATVWVNSQQALVAGTTLGSVADTTPFYALYFIMKL